MSKIVNFSVAFFVLQVLMACNQTTASSVYEGRTDRGGSWVKNGVSLLFMGDRLNGTTFNPSTMTGSVMLDGAKISGCKFSRSGSNPKGIRIGPCSQKTGSGLDEPSGLGVRTQ